MRTIRWLAVPMLAALAACGTYQAYEGPSRSGDEVAIIRGDAKVRALAPVALVIRAVDGKTVDARYSSVAVLPGAHDILIDCQVGAEAATASTSRFEVEVTVQGGERYRLREELDPGSRSCKDVTLEPA